MSEVAKANDISFETIKTTLDQLRNILIQKYPDIDRKKLENPVYTVQFVLKNKYGIKNVDGSNLSLDGIFGSNTFFAITQFQRGYLKLLEYKIGGERIDGVVTGREVRAFIRGFGIRYACGKSG